MGWEEAGGRRKSAIVVGSRIGRGRWKSPGLEPPMPAPSHGCSASVLRNPAGSGRGRISTFRGSAAGADGAVGDVAAIPGAGVSDGAGSLVDAGLGVGQGRP